jgi:hypothetical protein
MGSLSHFAELAGSGKLDDAFVQAKDEDGSAPCSTWTRQATWSWCS